MKLSVMDLNVIHAALWYASDPERHTNPFGRATYTTTYEKIRDELNRLGVQLSIADDSGHPYRSPEPTK